MLADVLHVQHEPDDGLRDCDSTHRTPGSGKLYTCAPVAQSKCRLASVHAAILYRVVQDVVGCLALQQLWCQADEQCYLL
jgi:hypothetical protein